MHMSAIFVALTTLALDVAGVGAKDDLNALPPGHMQHFGAHRPAEGDVESLDRLPDPKTFFEKYLKVGKPVLFRGAAKQIPAFKLWTDKYLAEKYGDLEVDCENGKKENRSHDSQRLELRKFLDAYKDSDVYMVQDVPSNMKGELSMIKPIMCGGYKLEVAVMWFSSGNTKSVMHTDDIENINCIFDGHKDIVFVDKKYMKVMQQVGWNVEGSFSDIDVEKVDMKKYAHLADVPWWRARMEKGDCLYIPFLWYHTVASSKSRNFACNIWFNPLLKFNDTDCAQRKQPLPDYESLAKYEFCPSPLSDDTFKENLRYFIFEPLRDLEELHMSDMLTAWNGILTEDEVMQVFSQVDTNANYVISWDEVNDVDIMAIVRRIPHILPKMRLQNMVKEGEEEQEEIVEEGAGEGDMKEEEGEWEETGKDEL